MEFALVSGNLALDLAGTLRWRRTAPEEVLVDPDTLRSWLVASGAAPGPVDVDAAALTRALALREAAYRLARDRLEGRAFDPDALDVVNAAAAGPAMAIALTPDGLVRRGGVDAALGDVARSLITLLGDPAAPPLKECGRDACTRLYLDRSRGARRTWCGMDECGNRVKAAAYRARRRGAG
ncbi:CGNR zinc finger domain-containing protein [Actinomycetospora lutea]|uniref:CGNR zinc finger domain-containing protein n=1 Tax=Actinomycetospora lutea TaxID=663604 RepID=UPI0023654623|nr:CGNR zinc finger domain-containing protein [Actinomycetospora lutea]MDD7939780.1 CGNR zinc finger domain-containing protein [Actinomycetospora lutea]